MNSAQSLKIPKFEFPEDIFTFYLSHPFASRKRIRKWELDFEDKHPHIALMNPFYDVEGEGREDVRARDEGVDFEKTPGYNWRLVQRDYIAICYSRGILGIVDDNADKSIGTIMEFVMGRVLAKSPKLLICQREDLLDHPWLNTHFHKIYKDFKDFEENVDYQVQRWKEKWEF
jgi:hypothetical protein